MWGIGFSIVQARMRKLLKRLIASPMRKSEYLLAQIGGRLVLLAPEAGVPLLFGVLALGMPIRGSLVTTSIVCLVGALAFGGVGLLLASRARTFEAISGLDEPHDGPDVDRERRVLLLVELPAGGAARTSRRCR